VGADFPLAVKLNSADFQRGGFDFADSLQVAKWLQAEGLDLLEISGGTYEQPKLLGIAGIEEEEPQQVAQSTRKREAYFVDFALAMREEISMPLMVTGGFRLREAMEQAVTGGGADIIGLGRPMCVEPDAPAQILAGCDELTRYEDSLSLFPHWLAFLNRNQSLRTLAGFSTQYWFYAQLEEMGRHGKSSPGMSVFAATRRVMSLQKQLLAAR
jgi:2,4-dienoyl-CoA reductase-like NADH-dependent reductase (Old Yellow Enzyme family)